MSKIKTFRESAAHHSSRAEYYLNDAQDPMRAKAHATLALYFEQARQTEIIDLAVKEHSQKDSE